MLRVVGMLTLSIFTLSAQNNFFALKGLLPIQWRSNKQIVYIDSNWYISAVYWLDSTNPYNAIILKLPSYPDRLIKAVEWQSPYQIDVKSLTPTTDGSLLWFLTAQDTFTFVKLDTSLNEIWTWRFVIDTPFTLRGWHIEDDSVAWLYGYVLNKSNVRLIKVNLQQRTIKQWKIVTSFTPYDVAISGLRGNVFLLNADEPREDAYIFTVPMDSLQVASASLIGFGVSINVVGTSGTPFFKIYPLKYVDDIAVLGGEITGAGFSASDAILGYFRKGVPMIYAYTFGSYFRSDYFCGFASVYPDYNVATTISKKNDGRNFILIFSGDLKQAYRYIIFDDVFSDFPARHCAMNASANGFLIVGERPSIEDPGTYELRWAFISTDTLSNWNCINHYINDVEVNYGPRDTFFMWDQPFQVRQITDPQLAFQDTTIPYPKQEARNLFVSTLCVTSVPVITSLSDTGSHSAPWRIIAIRTCQDGFVLEIQCNSDCSGRELTVQIFNIWGQLVHHQVVHLATHISQVWSNKFNLTPSGMYLIVVTDGLHEQTVKIAKQ